MIKDNKGKMILGSVIILLPIFVGVALWDKLPEQVATHWGANGEANGWSSREFAVFGLPIFLLALHWICMLATAKDPRNKGQNVKIFEIMFWLCPVISLFGNGAVYAGALNWEVDMIKWVYILLGALFAVIGNYMPKCKQSYTIGIRVKWALENEANWNATHRLAGKIWFAGGILLALCVFLPGNNLMWVPVCIAAIIAVVPVVYSYAYYRKHG